MFIDVLYNRPGKYDAKMAYTQNDSPVGSTIYKLQQQG